MSGKLLHFGPVVLPSSSPAEEILCRLTEALEHCWSEILNEGIGDLVIYLDLPSLWPEPHYPQQQRALLTALLAVNVWYAQPHTTVWFMTHESNGCRLSDGRGLGWCSFEFSLRVLMEAHLRPSATSGDSTGALARTTVQPAPAVQNDWPLPLRLSPELARACAPILQGVSELDFSALDFGDAEAERLAWLLPLCTQLHSLDHSRLSASWQAAQRRAQSAA